MYEGEVGWLELGILLRNIVNLDVDRNRLCRIVLGLGICYCV